MEAVKKIVFVLLFLIAAASAGTGGGDGVKVVGVAQFPSDSARRFYVQTQTLAGINSYIMVSRDSVGTLAYDQYFQMALMAVRGHMTGNIWGTSCTPTCYYTPVNNTVEVYKLIAFALGSGTY